MIHFLLSFFKTKAQLQFEIIFLRKQLEILNRTTKKAQITSWDKLFFSTIISLFKNWKESLIIIKPETIIRWHRKKFYKHLLGKIKQDAGRPRASKEVIKLIKQIANDNPMWGVPRIHGELLKLGYDISQATVWRYVPKKNGSSNGQRWKTFLKNHASEIISIDYFSVPTINFKILHVLVFLSHHRRKIIHFNVTSNPTSEWASQQLRNAFHDSDIPKYLIRDRDSRFGNLFKNSVF